MRVIIVGGGKTPHFLCRTFIAKGHHVVIINRDRAECRILARDLRTTVIHGDGSDPKVLAEAGAMGADLVLAVTPHDQDNLVICQLARRVHGVPRVLAQANDPENQEIFEKLGVAAFSTTAIIGSLIEQRASVDHVTNMLPVAGGRVNVTEIVLDDAAPVAGKLLKDVSLPENALVAVVSRRDQTIIPRGGSQLLPGDRVVLITLPENHGHVLRILTGE